jgi:hypothetical protein
VEIQKQPLDAKAFDKVLKAADTSGEGSVDSGEIAVVLKKVHDADKNHDGKLDKAESKALAKSLGDKSLAKSFEGADVEALSDQINFPAKLKDLKPMPPIVCPPWPFKGGHGEIEGHLRELGKALEKGTHPHFGMDPLPPPEGGMTTIELTPDQLKALTELLKKLTRDGDKPTPCIGLDPHFGGKEWPPKGFDPVDTGAKLEKPGPKLPKPGGKDLGTDPKWPGPDFDPIGHGVAIEQPLPPDFFKKIPKGVDPMKPPICIGLDPRFRGGSIDEKFEPIPLTPDQLDKLEEVLRRMDPNEGKPTICIGLDPRFRFGKI